MEGGIDARQFFWRDRESIWLSAPNSSGRDINCITSNRQVTGRQLSGNEHLMQGLFPAALAQQERRVRA
jgi:hypothetical protein